MNSEREAEFASFFHEHEASLRTEARALVAAAEVDHLVAATFTTAWQRFEEIPSASARAWLTGVLRNQIRNAARSRRRLRALVEQLAALRPTSETGLFAQLADPIEVSRLQAAVDRLNERDRELIRLAVWQELQPAEIAALTGAEPTLVRVRLHRARTRLIQLINESPTDDG